MALSGNPWVRGGGLAGALAQGAQGALQGQNMRREMDWQDKQRAQIEKGWEAPAQDQELEQTAALPGETDADRLLRIADLADKMGRGDKASKYRAAATSMSEDLSHKATAQAAQLIYAKNYPQATELLNKSGKWGKIQQVGPGSTPGTFSVTYLDESTGQPKTSELEERILPIIAADPKGFAAQMQQYQTGKDTESWRRTQDQNTDQAREEKVRHSKATEAFLEYKAKHPSKGGAGGKTTKYEDLKAWAMSNITPNGERRFLNTADAMQWLATNGGLPMQEMSLAARTAQINEDPAPTPRPALPGHGPGIQERGVTPPRDTVPVASPWAAPAPAKPATKSASLVGIQTNRPDNVYKKKGGGTVTVKNGKVTAETF